MVNCLNNVLDPVKHERILPSSIKKLCKLNSISKLVSHADVSIAMPKHLEKENIRVINAYQKLGIQLNSFNYRLNDIDPAKLNNEIDDILLNNPSTQSIPQTIISSVTDENSEKYPMLKTFKLLVEEIILKTSAVIIPGGISIHPKFYGHKDVVGEKRGFYDQDPRRTIFEFFLINACKTKGIPLLGICRGHQLINIYHDGILDRDSVGEIQLSKIRELASEQSPFSINVPQTAFFNHRQTVTKAGMGLIKTMSAQTVKDIDEEVERLNKHFKEAVETIQPGREFYEEMEATEIYDSAMHLLNNKSLAQTHIFEQLQFLEQENIVIASENQFGAPLISVQFHPEDFDEITGSTRVADKVGNLKILQTLALMANAYQSKMLVIRELKTLTGN